LQYNFDRLTHVSSHEINNVNLCEKLTVMQMLKTWKTTNANMSFVVLFYHVTSFDSCTENVRLSHFW